MVRARQACFNCRRKKTRCYGERPGCSLCMRLDQHCEYPTASTPRSASNHPQPTHNEEDLAGRVSRLEASLRTVHHVREVEVIPSTSTRKVEATTQSWPSIQGPSPSPPESGKFSQLPPTPVLNSLVDVFFAECHCQPYCFFHESSFRRRFDAGEVPQYLLLAFAATAARYSHHDYFECRQSEAVDALSRSAWTGILNQAFTEDTSLELAAAQATPMLAVIDFTAGRHKLGWFKIGLAVRLVQVLKLNTEPDHSLPLWDQEERRRVFWSVYMLDKFVSCGMSRPPAILDRDCTVALPCSAEAFKMEIPTEMLDLSILQDFSRYMQPVKKLDYFALLVLMSSMLGMVVRCVFQPNPTDMPLWDCRSNFSLISGILASCESMHRESTRPLRMSTQERDWAGETERAGSCIWSRGIYHLCCCLLYHPVHLYRHRQAFSPDFPVTIARELLARCREHATELANTLKLIQEERYCARGSFLGYLATCAASVHILYAYSPSPSIATPARALVNTCLDFLEQPPVYWTNHTIMALTLRGFNMEPDVACMLTDPSQCCADTEGHLAQIDCLRRLIDYGLLTGGTQDNQNGGIMGFIATPNTAFDPYEWFLDG